jgi:5-methylcytosine-specific restriction endonuclease McrA
MSAILTSKKCLVLNKNWTPVGTVTLQRAIIMLFSEYDDGTPKAKIIEPDTYQTFTWEDWSKFKPLATDESIAAANVAFKIPEIILLSRYEKLPKPKVHFSRRTLYKRDKMTCQYCGAQPGSEELTIDHVTPRAQGGLTTWENCVLACVECNRKKADRTPKQARMKLLSEPKKPDLNSFRYDTIRPVKSWESFIGTAYWSVPLGDANDRKHQ